MRYEIDVDTLLEIGGHEAIIRQAYKDSEGVWTWSVGITSASGHSVERYIDKPQSLEYCLEVYIWLLRKYADEVEQAFGNVSLKKHEFVGALSFHWNTGAIRKATWVKHFKQGNMDAAARAFMAWNKPKAIVERREEERDLIFKGKWSNNGTITEYTKLTSNHTPDWSSGVRVNIRPIAEKLLGKKDSPVPQKEEPKVEEYEEALAPMSKKVGFWEMIINFFRKLGRKS